MWVKCFSSCHRIDCYIVRDNITLTCPAATAVASLSATSHVIRIPSHSANRNPLNPIGKVHIQGTQATAAGTGSIIAGTSVEAGAVALL